MPAHFPFTAIIGQEAMQTAMLICAVDPAIGGVLVRGQKGTAKSTAARSLASLLPEIDVVPGCPYHCDPDAPELFHDECRAQRETVKKSLPRERIATPFVDLPLSTTEDRLIGTLDLQATLRSGRRHFEPGLFAAANRGILYVDEVNLLPDHLVDLLLDVAVSGNNQVEREGLQFNHESRFIMIGTMNPEEGELRPQFLDRFGLCVTIAGLKNLSLRREIVNRRLTFDSDPEKLIAAFVSQEETLRQQISKAREHLNEITVPEEIVDQAVTMAMAAGVQGHRAELTLVRAARALAAILESDTVTTAELNEVAGLALAHRIPGSSVLSEDELAARISTLLIDQGDKRTSPGQPGEAEEFGLMDNMAFPGSAAAGSMLFTYLKKKMKTDSSAPTNPLT